MSDLTPTPTGSSAPPPRPRTSGWVKLGTGLAVIGAEITESVLHPEVAEGLAIADVAIPLIVGLILFITIVRGSRETVERIFRLLRWITNRPEPTAPGSPTNSQPSAAAAEHPSAQITVTSPALPTDAGPSAADHLRALQAPALREFDVPLEEGLSRAQASTAFEEGGLDPRSLGLKVVIFPSRPRPTVTAV